MLHCLTLDVASGSNGLNVLAECYDAYQAVAMPVFIPLRVFRRGPGQVSALTHHCWQAACTRQAPFEGGPQLCDNLLRLYL